MKFCSQEKDNALTFTKCKNTLQYSNNLIKYYRHWLKQEFPNSNPLEILDLVELKWGKEFAFPQIIMMLLVSGPIFENHWSSASYNPQVFTGFTLQSLGKL